LRHFEQLSFEILHNMMGTKPEQFGLLLIKPADEIM